MDLDAFGGRGRRGSWLRALGLAAIAGCTQQLPVVEDAPEGNASQAGASSPSRGPASDRVAFDVAWRPDTLVVEPAAQQQAGVAVSGNTVTIAQPSAAMNAVLPGAHLMLPGEGLFKIESTQPTANGLALTVSEGSLLDAADSGRIDWAVELDPAKAVAVALPALTPDWVSDKADYPPFSYSGMLGLIKAKLDIDNDDARTHIKTTLEMPTKIKTVLQADAWVTRGQISGVYAFQAGQITDFRQMLSGIGVEAEFSLEGGGQPFDEKIELPIGVYFPITLGGLPAYMGISTLAVLRATTEINDKISFKIKLKVSGDQGMSVLAGFPMMEGSLKLDRFDTEDWEVESTASSALAVTLELPRYTFGLGKVTLLSTKPPDSSLGLYMAGRFETVTNAVVKTFLATGTVKGCTFISRNAEVKVGGEIKGFGLSVSKDAQLWFAAAPPIMGGPNCDEIEKP